MDQIQVYFLSLYRLDGEFEEIAQIESFDEVQEKIKMVKIKDIMVKYKDNHFKEIITGFEIPLQVENVLALDHEKQVTISTENIMESFTFAKLKKDYTTSEFLNRVLDVNDVRKYIMENNSDRFKKELHLYLELGKVKYKEWMEKSVEKGTIFPKI